MILSDLLFRISFSSDASICSTMVFSPLGHSNHVVVSVSIDFPSYSQGDVLFHHITYAYSRADWDSLQNHLRDVPLDDIFKLGASAADDEFCVWDQVGIDVYIPHRKYHSSLTHLHGFQQLVLLS